MNRTEFVEGLRERWRNVLQKTTNASIAALDVKKYPLDSAPRLAAQKKKDLAEQHLDAALCEVADFIYDTVPAHPFPVRTTPSRPSEDRRHALSTSAQAGQAGTLSRADEGVAHDTLADPEE